MNDCVFCKIRDREIPKKFTYEDDDIMVFPDLYPIKPIHLLIVSKKHIEDFLVLEDKALFQKMKAIVSQMIKKFKLEKRGYRLVVNGGGAQIITHFHIHLLGPMGKHAKTTG